MKNNIIKKLSKALLPSLALTCFLLLACSSLVNAQDSKVFTIVPQGKDFSVQFDERELTKLYPKYVAQQATARLSRPVTIEEFREFTEQKALSLVRTVFPNGVPSGATSRIKISGGFRCCPLEAWLHFEY